MGRAGVEPAEIIKDDPRGAKHGMGIREGATENAEVPPGRHPVFPPTVGQSLIPSRFTLGIPLDSTFFA